MMKKLIPIILVFLPFLIKVIFASEISCYPCLPDNCQCIVEGCGNQFILRIWSNPTCSGLWDREISGNVGEPLAWVPGEPGVYYGRVFDGSYCTPCTEIIVSSPTTTTSVIPITTTRTTTTTTTIKREFKISQVNCNKYSCEVEISKNTLEEGATLIILLKSDSGKVYYISVYNLEGGFTGTKTVSLINKNFCPSGVKLTVLALAYNKDRFNERIDRLRDIGFSC